MGIVGETFFESTMGETRKGRENLEGTRKGLLKGFLEQPTRDETKDGLRKNPQQKGVLLIKGVYPLSRKGLDCCQRRKEGRGLKGGVRRKLQGPRKKRNPPSC